MKKKRKVKKEEWERENQAIVCIKEALYVVASVAIFPPPDVWSYEVDPNGRRLGEIRLRENFQKAAKIKDTTTYQYHTWKKELTVKKLKFFCELWLIVCKIVSIIVQITHFA